MSPIIEEEFKTIINADAAAAVLRRYDFAEPFTQTNTYYDTPEGLLKDNRSALRLREFSDHAEMTLKIAQPEAGRHIAEYTAPLNDASRVAMAAGFALPLSSTITAGLAMLGIVPTGLQSVAKATTERREAIVDGGTLTIDATTYPDGANDWELELEYKDAARATTFWNELLQTANINAQPAQNKIARAIAHHA